MTLNILNLRFYYCLSLFFISYALPTIAEAQSFVRGLPFIRSFSTADYNAGIQNWDVTQDRRGLIYVANNFGLLEYDGDQWQLYQVKNTTKVRSVAIDSQGHIYVGCQGDFGYFFPNKAGKLVYTSLADSLPTRYRQFDETWSVYVDNEKVYFCTFARIYVYNGKTFTIGKGSDVLDLSFLVNRKLYVNQRNQGLSQLVDSTIVALHGGDFFASRSISSIVQLHGEQLLISTSQHGIYKFVDGEAVVWNSAMQKFFVEANVNCMIRLRNGNFAIGTQNEGLIILNAEGNLIMQMTQGKGLENRTVLSLHEDDLNNVWIGHSNGLAYVELGSPFSLIDEQSGLPGTGYSAYLDDNRLYMGTNTGLYVKDKLENRFTLVPNSNGQIYHVGQYDHDILVGQHTGTMRLDGNKGVTISSEPGGWIYLPLIDQPTKLIGGSYAGLQLYKLSAGHWVFDKKLAGFAESSRVMAQDNAKILWVTHGYKGAYKIQLNDAGDNIVDVKYYGVDKGFPTNRLINVYKIRNELLFTSESGVYKYDASSDKFIRDELFTSKMGNNVQIWSMQEDALGNIYFIGREHIGVMRKNAIGDYVLESSSFNKIRKLLNDDLENITILKNNEVLFGAKEGFIHYDPTVRSDRKTVFKTLIRKVSTTNAGDSALFFGNYIHHDSVTDVQLDSYKPDLPFKNNDLNFTFAATSYEGDDEVVYQYYLENYEKTWSEWSTKTQKEYTNLKEGSYTFHVRAKNVKGEVSSEAAYSFYINPPWYRSLWAYSVYGLMGMALLFTGFNLLDRKYQREQKLMELKQQKELNRKENEISKISQQSQEEINKLQNEKLESELQHKNNELATSTMHLLNKNEFISSIKTNLGHIIKKSVNEEVKKELQQITRDIENNISADADWEQFQFHFDRVHGDFSNRFKVAFPLLSPQEVKLSAYLRMNLSSKEIAQLLNISVRGVEISRYRLRKKLNLDRNRNLQDFILNF
ncbi:MAG TPA: triple tyrosine motif-containing protein [Cyclobacteriaceae bacterium]